MNFHAASYEKWMPARALISCLTTILIAAFCGAERPGLPQVLTESAVNKIPPRCCISPI
jgi:hypothetical protein